jgi:alkanesulfonate monooxygenase SsuD/methylene tetrahydromethanopterin reductase-like flavin-dependent oxidoreductase (luciferase family)
MCGSRSCSSSLKTSINVHGFVATTTQEAADTFYAPQAEVMNRIGRERGWPPTSRQQFDVARGPREALFVGSPAEVTDKILEQCRF